MIASLAGFSQLNGLVVETPVIADAPAGTTTYQLYATFDNPADAVLGVVGILNCHPLSVSTTTSWYNNSFGQSLGHNIQAGLIPVFPPLAADSWVTIGAQNDTEWNNAISQFVVDTPFDPDPADPDHSEYVANRLGTNATALAGGASISINDGTWFNAVSVAASGPDNRVLLGQFTTDGEFTFELNLSVYLGGSPANRVDYVHTSACENGGTPTGFESYDTAFLISTEGCTDDTACNYDPNANIEDNSCLFPGDACDDGNPLTSNDQYQGDCSCAGSLAPVEGCTNPAFCEYDPAANTDDGSCVTPAGCTNPLAANYDETAGCDDASCVFNEDAATAIALPVTALGTCASTSGDMDLATIVAPEATATATAGLWYSFVASTPGARIEVNTADFDVVIELQDALNNAIEVEDVVAANSLEVLNIGTLTAGETYFVRVAPLAPVAATANFDICVQEIPDTRCDFGPGPYQLCDPFKADYVLADSYVFNFTSQLDASTSTVQTSNGFSIIWFSNVEGIQYDVTYDVAIDAVFALTDGSGLTEDVAVINDEPCTAIIGSHPAAQLREQDNQANFGPHFITNYVAATPWMCGVVNWEWEFVNTDNAQLPFSWETASSNRYIRLTQAPGLLEGSVYEVRIRPVFSYGPGEYGEAQLLSIIGAAGLTVNDDSPVVVAPQADRSLIDNSAAAMLYPNPNNGEALFINLEGIAVDVERVMIDIYDVAGKRVISEQIAGQGSTNLFTQLSLSELHSGMYIVNIMAGEQMFTQRLAVKK